MARHHLSDVEQFEGLSTLLPETKAVVQGALDTMQQSGKDEPAPPTRKVEPETTVSKRMRKTEKATTR